MSFFLVDRVEVREDAELGGSRRCSPIRSTITAGTTDHAGTMLGRPKQDLW
jgi:hypothetical protein